MTQCHKQFTLLIGTVRFEYLKSIVLQATTARISDQIATGKVEEIAICEKWAQFIDEQPFVSSKCFKLISIQNTVDASASG